MSNITQLNTHLKNISESLKSHDCFKDSIEIIEKNKSLFEKIIYNNFYKNINDLEYDIFIELNKSLKHKDLNCYSITKYEFYDKIISFEMNFDEDINSYLNRNKPDIPNCK